MRSQRSWNRLGAAGLSLSAFSSSTKVRSSATNKNDTSTRHAHPKAQTICRRYPMGAAPITNAPTKVPSSDPP